MGLGDTQERNTRSCRLDTVTFTIARPSCSTGIHHRTSTRAFRNPILTRAKLKFQYLTKNAVAWIKQSPWLLKNSLPVLGAVIPLL